METKELPNTVLTVYVIQVGNDIFSVTIIIEAPVTVNNDTTTNWYIRDFCNHITGMMYDAKTSPVLSDRIRRAIIKRDKFDAEYIYYKTLSQYEI
jgi:hypothetical protein